MTPEEYIEGLQNARKFLDSIKNDIDRAIDKMERRLTTGYESLEQESRLATLTAYSFLDTIKEKIHVVLTSEIEY